jgi:hypothetical protein
MILFVIVFLSLSAEIIAFNSPKHKAFVNNVKLVNKECKDECLTKENIEQSRPNLDFITLLKYSTVVTALFPLSCLASSGMVVGSMADEWRFFLAGGICCAFSHAVVVPFDVAKTRLQVSPEIYTSKMVIYLLTLTNHL